MEGTLSGERRGEEKEEEDESDGVEREGQRREDYLASPNIRHYCFDPNPLAPGEEMKRRKLVEKPGAHFELSVTGDLKE